MTTYPNDYILSIALESEILPRHIECLIIGAENQPWKMRCRWQDNKIFLVSQRMLDLVVAANKIGLAGGEIMGVSLQGDRL